MIGLLLSTVRLCSFFGGDVEDDPENIKMREQARKQAQEECNECLRGTWSQIRDMFHRNEAAKGSHTGKRVDRPDDKKMR